MSAYVSLQKVDDPCPVLTYIGKGAPRICAWCQMWGSTINPNYTHREIIWSRHALEYLRAFYHDFTPLPYLLVVRLYQLCLGVSLAMPQVVTSTDASFNVNKTSLFARIGAITGDDTMLCHIATEICGSGQSRSVVADGEDAAEERTLNIFTSATLENSLH